QRFGVNPEAWRAYVARLSQDYSPLRLPEEEAPESSRYGARFYGLDLESDQVVFVCDTSGSMAGAKLERLQNELRHAVSGIRASGAFNLVFFETTVHPLRPQLADATRHHRKAAERRIDELEAHGGTNLWGGLQAALSDREADTIVVLTDGQPSAGRFQSGADILAEVRERNIHRGVRIHTVWVDHAAAGSDSSGLLGHVDESGPAAFLRRLAAENAGRFVIAR
ncbi:MAG: VWA domain-containing protein, partial [Planctomycetes bacterium]|nr:VWA domain-containing protein [Planctomycetota bacterium]